MERIRARHEKQETPAGASPAKLVIRLDRREAAIWCNDLADVARRHGWHGNDALFLQLGRFCVYVRGSGHHHLLHPVVLAPKQDFLSLVPIVCPPGHLTHLDAQAITDAAAQDPDTMRLIGAIYRFANSCEQVRTRPLPPAPLPSEGIDPELARLLEQRVTAKVTRLQDLADYTVHLLSAVFNSVTPRIVLDGPVAEITAAVEDLVGSRMAVTSLAPDPGLGVLPGDEGEGAGPDWGPAPPQSDPLRDIWNDVAAIRDLVQSRAAAGEKQRLISAAAEMLQARIIRSVEAALPSSGNGSASDGTDLDRFSEAVVARVNFSRLCRAVIEIREALPAVLDVAGLRVEVAAAETALAASVGRERARSLCAEAATAVERERTVDRAVDRLLDAAADARSLSAQIATLQAHVSTVVGEDQCERLLAPIRTAIEADPEAPDRQALRDHGIGLLLALSSHNERRLESLFTAGELSETDAWRAHGVYRALVGANIAEFLLATLDRLSACLGADPVPAVELLAEKQALWGLAYEVLNWVETRSVATSVAANARPFAPEAGTFSHLCLADGTPLSELAARAAGLTQPLEPAVPVLAETPVLLSARGDLLVPGRTHKLIGGVADVGTFRLTRQATRWDIGEAAELMSCSDSEFWVVFHSTLGALYPAPAAIAEAVECARRVGEAGGCAAVWCGVAHHGTLACESASLHAYRFDMAASEAVLAAASAYESVMVTFDRSLEARLEEMEAGVRATGYAYPRLIAAYHEAAPALKEVLRSFAREHPDALSDERWVRRASEEVDAFARFAAQALRDAQRQATRTQQAGTRALIAALYEIDDRKAVMRHRLTAAARDAACEALLVARGLLRPAAVRLAWDAGQTSAALPTSPEALPEARAAAFIEAYLGADADEEQRRRLLALCHLAEEILAVEGEPGPASALLLDFLGPVREPLFARERGRPLLAVETFSAFVDVLRERRQELAGYLARRPECAETADAVVLALLIRGMACRRSASQSLWEPVAAILKRGASLLGYPVADLVHLSDAEEAGRLLARLREGDLQADTRLAARVVDDAERELGVDPRTASPQTLALVRDDLLAILHRNLERARERLLPERELFFRLAAGSLSEEDRRRLQSGPRDRSIQGRRQRRGRRPGVSIQPDAAVVEDLDAARARLAEAARRCADYERLAASLAPYAGDTTGPLYPFLLSALAGSPAEVVRPALTPAAALPQALSENAAPETAAAAESSAARPDESAEAAGRPGPVDLYLAEFDHLGRDGLAADLVEAALVLFPNEEHVRETLSGSRKQVLDAVLAREFPALMRSTRMQIVVAVEPRGLRLHDISDLAKMVSEGGATASEVRTLLRSM
ncbi:MAG: hypothetical protein HY321_00365 [Armatimonadetes bacterium]|nr:hypothetical protein [Armatimonadota bacterium]